MAGDATEITKPAALPFVAEMRAGAGRLYASKHRFAFQAKAYADAVKPPYADYGQWDGLAYLMTGETSYARAAARVLLSRASALAGTDRPIANDVRQQASDLATWYALIEPELTDAERAAFKAAFVRVCEFCFAVNFPQYVGGFRTGDSDQSIGQALLVWITDLLFGTDWRAYKPAGAAPVDFPRVIKAIHDYLAMSKGGEFIESYHYNLNTVALLLTARTVLGDEFTAAFPEFDPWAEECATFFLACLTPDGNDIFKWGDLDSKWNGLDLPGVLTLLYLLYNQTGRRDVWGAIVLVEDHLTKIQPLTEWLYLSWRVLYALRDAPTPLPPEPIPEPAPKTIEDRIAALEIGQARIWDAITSAAPIARPTPAPTVAVAPKPRAVFTSPGNGHVRYNDGRVLFGCHVPCAGWRGDHCVSYTSDFRAWVPTADGRGVWWIDRPDGYAGISGSGYAGNSPLFAGFSSMWTTQLKSVEETETGVVVTSTTSGGPYAPGAWGALLPFVSNYERRLEFDRAGRVTVRDTFEGKDPRPARDANGNVLLDGKGKPAFDPCGYTWFAGTAGKAVVPAIERELSAGRLWQQVLQCPSEPRETATGFEYRVPGLAAPVIVVAPAGVKREVLLTADVLTGYYGPEEITGWHQIRLSSVAEKIAMETTLQLGA